MFVVRFVACCALFACACGAGDTRVDPADLELRDVLGMAPDVAMAWDADQRAAARRVIDDGLHQVDAPVHAALAKDGVPTTLAAIDADRAKRHARALGLVHVDVRGTDVLATAKVATLAPHAQPVAIQLEGWDGALAPLPARGLDVLAEIATDAGHRAGPLVVAPAPQLAAVAAYLPGTPARLVVNPVVLAVLEPTAATARTSTVGPATTPPATTFTTSAAEGNPYSFYGSVGECAAAQAARCDACLAKGNCSAITSLGDGNAECTQLAANGGRGYSLICIDLAIAIDSVSSCAAGGAPQCPRDTHASESIATIENNANFLDDPACSAALDVCLSDIYGASKGTFGSDAGTDSNPRNTAVDCANSCSGDSNCDDNVDCQADGPACDDSSGGCSSSNDQSGCSDSGGSSGGGGCSDGEDSCGSSDNSGCSSSDCGGGGDSSCGDSGGGDCGGGGGDCSGGGGDCSGGGGDCGGGGGDCNAGKRAAGAGAGLPIALAWALLPVPFATRVRRRAVRKRARDDAERGAAS